MSEGALWEPAGLSRRAGFAGATLLAVASLLLSLNHLDHRAIKGLDESFHAVVAKNLLKHPLTPMLYERAYLEQDWREWQTAGVWLHKPILPFWQMAGSLAVFGTSTLALRLASALLAAGGVLLTYAIGALLIGRLAGLIGAAVQAFTPGLFSLVQGYVFSDHVDVSMLFWTELAVLFVARAAVGGRRVDVVLAGIAQGAAFLSKTYPAFVVTGIACVACLLPGLKLKWRDVALLVGVTILAVAPWTIACMVRFPREFWHEQAQVFRHLGADVEGWAAPWDRLVFDYSLRIYQVFYVPVLAGAAVLLPRAIRERDSKLLVIYAWALGVLIPHVIATSKTPTATLIGWPASLLLFGAVVSRALAGDGWALGAWAGATLLGALWPGKIQASGWGYPETPGFAVIARQNIWVLWHFLTAMGVGWIVAAVGLKQRVRLALVIVACAATLVLFYRNASLSYRVTARNENRPDFSSLGAWANANTPENAVLLIEPLEKLEHMMAMFWTERTCYPITAERLAQTARQVRERGGLPLVVAHRAWALPLVWNDESAGLFVYALTPAPAPSAR